MRAACLPSKRGGDPCAAAAAGARWGRAQWNRGTGTRAESPCARVTRCGAERVADRGSCLWKRRNCGGGQRSMPLGHPSQGGAGGQPSSGGNRSCGWGCCLGPGFPHRGLRWRVC
eukprot:1160646-Pelagomonas_calceolata.AAC.1